MKNIEKILDLENYKMIKIDERNENNKMIKIIEIETKNKKNVQYVENIQIAYMIN